MKDDYKTKIQLINELAQLRQKITELEKSEADYKQLSKYVNTTKDLIRDVDGKPIEIAGSWFDITDRRHAEEELKEREKELEIKTKKRK